MATHKDWQKSLDKLLCKFIESQLQVVRTDMAGRMEDVVLEHIEVWTLDAPVFDYKAMLRKPAVKQRKLSDVLNINSLVA